MQEKKNKLETKRFSIRKLAVLSVLTTIALTIFIVESYLPTLIPIPGIKLGLANIVTLFVILRFDWKDAGLVLLVRIILGSIFAGQAVSFLYSLAGGVLCLLVMALINHLLNGKAVFITSVFGALAHNVGQILVALFMLRLTGILAYLPFLIISGVVTGLFTGLACYFANRYIPKQLTENVKNA